MGGLSERQRMDPSLTETTEGRRLHDGMASKLMFGGADVDTIIGGTHTATKFNVPTTTTITTTLPKLASILPLSLSSNLAFCLFVVFRPYHRPSSAGRI